MLKFGRLIGVMFLIAGVSGCSVISRSARCDGSRVSGQIIDSAVLERDARIAIVPFSAGVEARASEELDRASLLVLRGIQDGLEAAGSPLYVVSQETAADLDPPDLQIIGRIECYETRDRWLRYIGGQRKRRIELRGRVLTRQGNLVAEFIYERQRPYAQMSEVEFLLEAGRAVGMFLSPARTK